MKDTKDIEALMPANIVNEWNIANAVWKVIKDPAAQDRYRSSYNTAKLMYDSEYAKASGKLSIIDSGSNITLYNHVDKLYSSQIDIIKRMLNEKQKYLDDITREVTGYERTNCAGNLCTNRCDIEDWFPGGTKGRCHEIRGRLMPTAQSQIDAASNILPQLDDERSNWVDMLRDGPINFQNDFSDTLDLLIDVAGFVAPAAITPAFNQLPYSFDNILKRPDFERNMPNIRRIENQDKIESADLTRRIWLAIPNNLEKYIFVSPTTFKAYIRKTTAGTSMCKPIFKKNNSGGNVTYQLDAAAVASNVATCNTEITPDLLALIPVPAQNFIAQYIRSRIKRVKKYIMEETADYKAAAAAFYAYSADISTVADDGKTKTARYPARDLPSYGAEQLLADYLRGGNAAQGNHLLTMVRYKTAQISDLEGTPLMVPNQRFNIYAKNRNTLFNQIAQGFYDLGDGTISMSYIYDIYPVGSSILDVRFLMSRHSDPRDIQVQMDTLKATYMQKIATNLSQNEYDAATSAYRDAYQVLKDKQDSNSVDVSGGATARLFYTMNGDTLRITGYDGNGLSFYTAYNCGIVVATDDTPGKINYAPVTMYSKNSAPTLNCADPVMLRQIGEDYATALVAGDLSGQTDLLSDAWDDTSGSLIITRVLGAQQLSPSQCAIQWEETVYNSATNRPDPATVRNVAITYRPNTTDWYANELLFDASGFKYLNGSRGQDGAYSWNILPLATPISIPKPYPDSVNLDNAQGTCPQVSCKDPDIMYSMIDEYNTTDEYPGIILRVIKCTTLNEGECDVLVDMDYTRQKGSKKAPTEKAGKILREQLALTLSLDIASCKYSLVDAAPGFGVQDNTPSPTDASGLAVGSFDYMQSFAAKTFSSVTTATNRILDQVSSNYTVAKDTLTTYRALTYANIGDLETFQGCPDVRCRNLDIMTGMMKKYDRDNVGASRMGKILRLGTSVDMPNACDVTFEVDRVGYDTTTGRPTSTPSSTAAMRFRFKPKVSSTYDAIFEERIAAATDPAVKAAIQAEQAEMNDQVSCAFSVLSSNGVLPAAPTWADINDLSNSRISVVNPSKTGIVRFSNPFPIQSVSSIDPMIMNLIRTAAVQSIAVMAYISSVTGNTLTAVPYMASGTVTPTMIKRITNTGLLSCAVELEVLNNGNTVTLYRSYNFTSDDGLRYKIVPQAGSPHAELPLDSIYRGLTASGANTYTFTSAPPLINQDIREPISLSVSPTCGSFDATTVMAYNGYDTPFDSFKRNESIFEIRVTENEYLPFGETYKTVSIYTDISCNPRINTITDSVPNGSHFAVPLNNVRDPRYYTAILNYFARYTAYVSDAKPRRRLGQIWRGGTDFRTGLIHFEVTMGEYDADDNVMNFYGWPQSAAGPFVVPRGVMACDFRKRFKSNDIYLANVYFLSNSSTVLTEENAPANQTITMLPSPTTMTSFKYLEVTPLTVRSGTRAQFQRIEFYSGNKLMSLNSGTYNFRGVADKIKGGVRQSIQSGIDEMFLNDALKIVPDTNSVFEFSVGTPIIASSATAMAVTGLSFMTGMNAACDVIAWRLRGSMNGKFWKDVASGTLAYPAYGYWRVPIMPGSVALTPNPNRPKGFIECGASLGLDVVNQLSALVYTNLSQIRFGAAFDEAQKNIKRAYLTGLPEVQIDDINNTIYLRGTIQVLDGQYNLTNSVAYFTLTYTRNKSCTFNYSVALATAPPTGWAPSPLSINIPTGAPFAWGGYPSALTKYKDTLGQTFETPRGATENTTTISSFLSNGPDRPANVILPSPLTSFTTLGLEGAAQMCADNTECVGFTWANGVGSFYTDPNSNTALVVNMNKKTYFKKGYGVVAYVRFRGMTSDNGVSLGKIAFYKGNTMLNVATGALYTIDSKGAQTNVIQTFGSDLTNLFNYMTAAGWSSAPVDGIVIQFTSPLIITGYTFVTNDPATAPRSWSLETSMNGTDWTVIDRRIVTPPPSPYTAYPLFRFGGQDSGIATNFSAKTFSSCGASCSSPSNIDLMIALYKEQRAPAPNAFQVRSIGRDAATDQCILGWANDTNETTNITGFRFNPTYGECTSLLDPRNVKITMNPVVQATLSPIAGSGPFRYFRFKPLVLNGGQGTCLAGIYFISGGARLEPLSCINPANNDIPSGTSAQVIDSYLNDWICQTLGVLVISFNRPMPVDSFTLYSGSRVAQAPKRWTLEGSVDGTIWSMLHDQSKADIVPPTTPATMYPIFSFNPNVGPIVAKSILEKSIGDFGKACDDATILGMVNDAATGATPSIFFNPTQFSYNAAANQCSYLQATGNVVEARFRTTVGGMTDILTVKSVSGPLTGTVVPITSGRLLGIADCNTDCKDDTLLSAMNTFWQNTGINSTKGAIVATKTGSSVPKNACLLELDSMYAPLAGDGSPALQNNRVGFQFKKSAACSTTPLIVGVDANITDAVQSPVINGPYKFIRFKVTNTKGTAPVQLSAFSFFKNKVELTGLSMVVTNPLGSGAGANGIVQLSNGWSDSAKKPLQFAFTTPLDFNGYSWTTSIRRNIGDTSASDPIAWTIQGSMNGILWTDIQSLTTDIRLPDSVIGFKMPIYGLDGSVTPRQTIPVSAPPPPAITQNLTTSGLTCRSVWPKAMAQYMDENGSGAAPSTPTKYGFDPVTNQCNYEFIDNDYNIKVYVGFKFNASNNVTGTSIMNDDPTIAVGTVSLMTPITY